MTESKPHYVAVDFDGLFACCRYASSDPIDINNGYVCNHPLQEETQHSNVDGKEHGYCYCSSCPLGYEPDADDVESEEIDWDGMSPDPDELSGTYLIMDIGEEASESTLKAFETYALYMHRYFDVPDLMVRTRFGEYLSRIHPEWREKQS